MNAELFISKLEQEWEEIEKDSKIDYRRLVDKFSDDERTSIFDELLRKCGRTPRIADIYSAANSLLISDKPRAATTKGCVKCGFTTWQDIKVLDSATGEFRWWSTAPCTCQTSGCFECGYSTWRRVKFTNHLTGRPYDAVTPCACRYPDSIPF